MKGPIFPILVIALILGGAYYYFNVMKKPDEKKPEEKPDEKADTQFVFGQPVQDHSSQAIADMFSGEDWRKAHPILI